MKLPRFTLPGVIAMLLAVGGCFWGMLLLPLLLRHDVSPLAIAIFGPGFLVTMGYIIRALLVVPLSARLAIWIASVLVQGAWLIQAVYAISERLLAGGKPNEPIWFVTWWAFATVASVVALLTERPIPRNQSSLPGRETNP